MDPADRRYRFTITVDIAHGHPAYDDPEWVADAQRVFFDGRPPRDEG